MSNDTKSLKNAIGKAIQYRRERLGLSQEELAESVDISQQALSRIERGIAAPRYERLQPFADALQCRIMDLFGIPEESPNATAVAIEELLHPLDDEERALVLKQLTMLTDFFVAKKGD